jgi:hypothetical protein
MNNSKLLKVILTGSTGMVGEGVLHECLQSPGVEKVLVVNRKPCGITHPKLQELLHNDFLNLEAIKNKLQGYNACLFCLGVSSVGMDKKQYELLTYTLTMHFADTLSAVNPEMVFCYISGAGTDSTENGKVHWARVKGKTENDLQKLPFAAVYNFRPAMLQPTPGLKNTLSFYKYVGWLIPLFNFVAPNYISRLADLGKSMIAAAASGYNKSIIEVKDIKILSSGV